MPVSKRLSEKYAKESRANMAIPTRAYSLSNPERYGPSIGAKLYVLYPELLDIARNFEGVQAIHELGTEGA